MPAEKSRVSLLGSIPPGDALSSFDATTLKTTSLTTNGRGLVVLCALERDDVLLGDEPEESKNPVDEGKDEVRHTEISKKSKCLLPPNVTRLGLSSW